MFLKRLSPRTLFSLTPSSSPSRYAQFSTSSPSHLTYPHSHSHPDPSNVGVYVWWDLENSNVPSALNVLRGAQAITSAIESRGIKGPIQISAFGDTLRHQEALSSTGIKLNHVPHGEDSSNIILRNLQLWTFKHSPPAHLFFIMVDVRNSCLLHRLRLADYNILLATKESALGRLQNTATIVWDWDALVRGENLTGRYFNQPPNGSWYGHYEGHLANPCMITKEYEDEILQQKPHEVFLQDSFWIELHKFIHRDIGSLIIAESNSKKKMAYYLRRYGPSVLKSVTRRDVLRMVHMLLDDKRWVRENSYSTTRPFQLSSTYSISKYSYAESDDDDFLDSE